MPEFDPAPKRLVAQVVERNIAALLDHRAQEEQDKLLGERIAARITAFVSSLPFVFLNLALFGLWVVVNLDLLPIRPFDPSFAILAVIGSIESILLSTFVLITQNRMAALSAKRADLDLHISLLAEHEVTRVLHLLTEVANRVGVDTSRDEELDELAQEVRPEDMLAQLDSGVQDTDRRQRPK